MYLSEVVSTRSPCALRPVTLVDGDPDQNAKVVERYEANSQISKGSVAALMLDAVKAPAPFTEKAVMIGQA